MTLQYTYVKERRRFGRPVSFFLRNEILTDFPPDKKEGKSFLTKWTVDKSTGKRCQFAVASVNTENAECLSRGMCHVEGGWPKDVEMEDEEQTLRYKKKLQRSEEYRIEMTKNLESMNKAVMQNAGVNVYENYFDKVDCANVLQCYRHPNTEIKCQATKCSFSIEQIPNIAVAYSQSIYAPEDENVNCPLVWDITQNECMELNSQSSCSAIEYHRKFYNIIAGGLQNGQICLWDVRDPSEPCVTADHAHQGYVKCLQWSHRNNFDMLSGSSNGEVFWWDIRKMNEPPCQFEIESMDVGKAGSENTDYDNLSIDSYCPTDNKNGCIAVEFDKAHSKNIHIGTGDGRVIFAHKNHGKLEKMYEIKCHDAAVSAVDQNWASYKCVLTVDSSDVKVWCDDMKCDPIFSLSSIENEFACGCWSPTRYSRFFIGKMSGSIQLWDLTFNHKEPYFTFKPTRSRVKDIRTNYYGNFMACCYNNGEVYAIELVDNVPGTIKELNIEELNVGNDEDIDQPDATFEDN